MKKKKKTRIGTNAFGLPTYREVCPFCAKRLPEHHPDCFGRTPNGRQMLALNGFDVLDEPSAQEIALHTMNRDLLDIG